LRNTRDSNGIVHTTKFSDGVSGRSTYSQHSQAMAMQELEAWITLAQLAPATTDRKVLAAVAGTVNQHDRPIRQLRKPGLELAPSSVAVALPVHVQEVYASIFETLQRHLRTTAQKRRERTVPLLDEAL
jgi:hypothetical protein